MARVSITPFLLILIIVSVFHIGNGARILGIFPMPSISHQIVHRQLTLALRDRGHELVVVTPDPLRDPNLKNYTEIDVSSNYNSLPELNYIDIRGTMRWIDWFWIATLNFHNHTEGLFNHPEFKRIYAPNSGEKFDLILAEIFHWPAIFSFAKRFDAPIIGISSQGLTSDVHFCVGNPMLISHKSNWDQGPAVFEPLTFWERLKNFVAVWNFIYRYNTEYLQAQHAIVRKHLDIEVSEIRELQKNVSLIFVNQQPPISYARPNVPKIIGIGNFHVSKKIEPMSKDLQKILDDSKQGFIYMSLGTNVKSTMLDKKTLSEFLIAFSKLPYTVIWKFEDEFLPGKPDNVIIMKWVPQQAILAHPNLQVFVYQGGLQSTEEAISHGVPVIGFPIMGDQDANVNKLASLGAGKKLEITDVKRDDLIEAIQSVVTDGSYKQRMLNLRELLNDRPHDLLKNAVWWTEHVIRHRGAPHLHSSTADEPWYQRQDMDIIFVITVVTLMTLIFTIFIFYHLSIRIISVFSRKRSVDNKKKIH